MTLHPDEEETYESELEDAADDLNECLQVFEGELARISPVRTAVKVDMAISESGASFMLVWAKRNAGHGLFVQQLGATDLRPLHSAPLMVRCAAVAKLPALMQQLRVRTEDTIGRLKSAKQQVVELTLKLQKERGTE